MEICQRTKAVIMGRKTYKILAPDNLPFKDKGTTIVLTSNTGIEPANPTVMFTNKSPEDIVALLEEKNQPEAVIVGGMATVTEFINSGLVDEIYLVNEPVLFGDGLPFFKSSELELKLGLISVEQSNYSIKTHYKILEQ